MPEEQGKKLVLNDPIWSVSEIDTNKIDADKLKKVFEELANASFPGQGVEWVQERGQVITAYEFDHSEENKLQLGDLLRVALKNPDVLILPVAP